MTDIIVSREQITPTWLSDTLAEAGIKATVVDVEVEPIIAGYYGSSSRLTLRYDQNDESLPRSLFLKMASEHPSARERAAESGMYSFEVGFYRDLAPWVNISTPRCFAAEVSDDNSAFVLLLEDAAPLVQHDQLQGLSLAQSKLAMQELAGLHASTWQGKGMDDCHWAKLDATAADAMAQPMILNRSGFVEQFREDLTAANIEILDRLANKSQAFWHYQLESKNQVAAHWDYRGDNMLFGQRNGELAMVAIDWTGLLSGGGKDLGHFLGTSLLPEVRKAHEIELLRHYHETLLAQGVTNFSLQECVDDYRRNLFYPIHVVLSVTDSVDVDDRGNRLFMSFFNRACDAIRESNALELIESL